MREMEEREKNNLAKVKKETKELKGFKFGVNNDTFGQFPSEEILEKVQ